MSHLLDFSNPIFEGKHKLVNCHQRTQCEKVGHKQLLCIWFVLENNFTAEIVVVGKKVSSV